MPLKGGRLSPQEVKFADQFAATGDRLYAAKKAGYGAPAPRASEALARPAVLAEIARRQQERLFNEALPLAINAVVSILSDAKAPAGARVQAAKVVFDRTLGLDEANKHKDPADMSPSELQDMIAQLQRRASELAKPVLELQANEPAEDQAESDVFA